MRPAAPHPVRTIGRRRRGTAAARRMRLPGAVAAETMHDDLMGARAEALELVLQPVEGALEAPIAEGLDPAALVAQQMVVVAPLLIDDLVAGRTPAEIHAHHEILLAEQLERAVDARPAHVSPRLAQHALH